MRTTSVALCAIAAALYCGVSMADSVIDAHVSVGTKISNGFNDIKVELSPEVEKAAKFADVKVDHKMKTFTVSGLVDYPKSCKFLRLDVKFIDKNGNVMGTAPAIMSDYSAHESTRFAAALLSTQMTSHGYLDIARIKTLTCL